MHILSNVMVYVHNLFIALIPLRNIDQHIVNIGVPGYSPAEVVVVVDVVV